MPLWLLILVFSLEVLFLFWGQRRVVPLLLQRSRSLAYFFALPGTVLHELSHFFTAKLLGVPTGRVELFRPRQTEDGALQLGMVESAVTTPSKQAAISAAPLLLVPLLLAAFLTLLFGSDLWSEPWESFSDAAWWKQMISLYLLLSSGGAAFPSTGDHIPLSGAIVIVILFLAILFLAQASPEPIMQALVLIFAPSALSSAFLLLLLQRR